MIEHLPPRSLSPASGEMKAGQRHGSGIDSVGGGLGVGTSAGLARRAAAIITFTTTVTVVL